MARELGAEIVVADPFQRYRGLEIAADAPRAQDRRQVAYHLVGDLDLAHDSTAGDFAERAHAVVDRLADDGDGVPIVAGGTGLYVRAALCDLAMRPPPPPEVRAWAEALAADPAAAMALLRSRDAAAADRVDPANPRRIARALERLEGGDDAASADIWQAPYRRPTLLVGVTRPRAVLHELIRQRVRREVAEGLVPELEGALARPDLARGPGQVIGMREVRAMQRGEMQGIDLEEALVVRTRRLARMQSTWLTRLRPDRVLDLADRPAGDACADVVAMWRRARGEVG